MTRSVQNRSAKLGAALAALTLASSAASAQSLFPIVTSVSENTAATQIAIAGSGFGTATADVYLAGNHLKAITSTSSSITAQLPMGVAAGSYLLTVMNNNTKLSGIFEVTLGAQGAQGLAGPAGPVGPAGAPSTVAGPSGPTGAVGATGASGGQLWAASFTLPSELNNTTGVTSSSWNQVRNCGPAGCASGPGSTVTPLSAIASPSGSNSAIALAPQLTTNNTTAFLPAPLTCTASGLNVYLVSPQNTPFSATITLEAADPVNNLITTAKSPQYAPVASAVSCTVISPGGGVGYGAFGCSSGPTAATLLTGGELVTMAVSPNDTTDALVNAQVMTSFNCDTTNTTGIVSPSSPVRGGRNGTTNTVNP